MIVEARQYQKDAGNAVVKSIRAGNDGVLCVMATGLGKTILAAMLAEYYAKQGVGVLFLAHRDQLIQQAEEKFLFAVGERVGVEKAERSARNHKGNIVVGSVQSMTPERLAGYDRSRFGVIITDEAHLSPADSYVRIYDHFSKAKRIGITATAFRQDSKALGDIYSDIAYEYGLKQAIIDGWLCRIVSETVKLDCDLSEASVYGGDYSLEGLETTILPLLGNIAQTLGPKIGGREKIISFLPLVKTSKAATTAFGDAGFTVRHVDGALKERFENIKWFEQNRNVMLCNPMMLSVGYDHPPVDTVVWLRPTTSTLLYTQGIGRGTRLCEGKEYLYVPDLIMNGMRHDLCRPACLYAETEEVEQAMNEIASGGGPPMGMGELEEAAENLLADRREAKLAKHIKEFKGMRTKTYDPVLGVMATHDSQIAEWKPRLSAENQDATPDQVRTLEAAGFDPTGWKKGYAGLVISKIAERQGKNLATPKQLRLLCRQHIKNADALTFEEASAKISNLHRRWEHIKRYKQGRK